MFAQLLQWLGLIGITVGVGLLLGFGAAVVVGGFAAVLAGVVLEREA